MTGLFSKVIDLSKQTSITSGCGCDLEDGDGCVGECYDVDCCYCENYSDD